MGILLRSTLPLGFVVLALAMSTRQVWGCILCDPAVVAGLRDLEHNYLPSHLNVGPEVLQTFMNRLEETVRQFTDLPIEENKYQGVIDEPTLRKVSWAFLKDLKRIKDSNLKDNFLLKELTWTLHVQKENFARLVGEFQKQGFCPNKCGLMMQSLIWCFGCEKQVHSCQKSYDCGAQTVQVTENGDMVLDCELNWHKAAEGLTEYKFYRVWPNGSEVLISEGHEAALTKPMVSLEDSGIYRCILGTVRLQNPATIITYDVQVTPEKMQEPESSDSGQKPTTETSELLDPFGFPSLTPIPIAIPTFTLLIHEPVDLQPGREEETTEIYTPVPKKTWAPGTKPSPAIEPGLASGPAPCVGHGHEFIDSGQNAARILNMTLIGLVAGGVAAVLGSMALT